MARKMCIHSTARYCMQSHLHRVSDLFYNPKYLQKHAGNASHLTVMTTGIYSTNVRL